MKSKCVTHFIGCPCHEERWANEVRRYIEEVARLREVLGIIAHWKNRKTFSSNDIVRMSDLAEHGLYGNETENNREIDKFKEALRRVLESDVIKCAPMNSYSEAISDAMELLKESDKRIDNGIVDY
jgi:hypothetical protein